MNEPESESSNSPTTDSTGVQMVWIRRSSDGPSSLHLQVVSPVMCQVSVLLSFFPRSLGFALTNAEEWHGGRPGIIRGCGPTTNTFKTWPTKLCRSSEGLE